MLVPSPQPAQPGGTAQIRHLEDVAVNRVLRLTLLAAGLLTVSITA
jgi:carboxypeptidase C (cathepsin A)